MSALVLAALLATADPTPTLAGLAQEGGRSGVMGFGVALEPLLGVLVSAHGDSGLLLGGALAWELTPSWIVRASLSQRRVFGGESTVTYRDDDDVTVSSVQEVDREDLTLAIGGSFLFRESSRPWAPYAGAELEVHSTTSTYRLDGELAGFQTPSRDRSCAPGEPGCRPQALGSSVGGAVRGGVRLSMLRWLQTQAELSLHYVPRPGGALSNTITAPRVRAQAESEWLVCGTFAVRLSL